MTSTHIDGSNPPRRKRIAEAKTSEGKNGEKHESNGAHPSNGKSNPGNGKARANGSSESNGTERQAAVASRPRVERRGSPRDVELGADADGLDKRLILQGLGALRRGEFGVRLTGHLTGLDGKIAEAFNEVADLNERLFDELQRLARVVGKEGRISQRAYLGEVRGAWSGSLHAMNELISDLVHPTSEMARVIGGVARGDLTQSMSLDIDGRPLEGEFLKTAQIVNTMVDQLASFSAEVTRVAREVGTDGKLGGQAKAKGVAGTWKELTDSVNSMAGNLTSQVRNIAQVTTAVANGDLSKKITVDVRGEFGELKDTINTMVDQLNSFAAEVTRVAREVGTDGKLGGQAHVKGVGGTWKDLTDSVNSMAGNLTSQMRNIVDVTKAVANGDLSKKITADAKGEILELKATINTMVDQLNSFASEVTRVAREVGTEGKLGGQADVRGVAGTWKDLTNSVNNMAANLTAQVRNVAAVTTAVAGGDLSKKITVDVRGEMLELKNTINTMVDQLSSFAAEVTRVAREVGTEGKLGGQAQVKGVAGTWKELTDNVNSMASNLTSQVRNIATVTTAVASGDLSKKITVDVRGEMLQMKNTINVMVDQLNSFAAEVTRVAREVGTDGKLGGQAQVSGVAGVWKDLTDSVNSMAGNLTGQVRNIATVTTAVANGDLSKKITVDVRGEMLELKDTINTMVDQLRSFAAEVTRVAREVGTDGKLGGQAMVRDVGGVWKDLTDNVNFMAGNLTSQVRNVAQVTTAVANGDLSKKITVDVRGEMLELKSTINVMVDQLNSFASEVTRVAREVGTEGKLGGQADVRGVGGVWKDLTDNVNFMAGNLTNQVRGIARVVTAVANGDLRQKFSMEAKGEIASLASTINSMIDTLATFADQVTTVAREVGVEGKLGGQANVPGASGTWKDLTENVNRLAANLTTQVRAIGEVATAVTKGDLTRSIKVDAQGELAALKDNVNEMIRNLKDTTVKTNEQDWLKTNLAKFSRMLQGQKDLLTVGKLILSELAPVVGAQQGVFYIIDPATDGRSETMLRLLASYAYRSRKNVDNVFKLGEGLVGQCALEKEKILLANVPNDYITVSSGLGESSPANIIVLPVLFESNVKAVIELASFERFSVTHLAFLDQLTESIGIVLNTIEANMRTEDLLKQSQSLARELQSQQMELQSTNTQLEEKAKLLADQNAEVERKNSEVEQARQALEEKATQLALTSKYKSEFLANMSHELRTPLNSLLILSDHLSKNSEKNLTERQMEFLKTIHGSGTDLLSLINDILDLSKIESGTVVVDVGDVALSDLMDYVDRTFRHVADSKKLTFELDRELTMPRAVQTDAKRLQQVLKNLLSNAFKFTERGRVSFRVQEVKSGWSSESEQLAKAKSVIAFTVADTGIGIPAEKQQIIFEAFQQADGSTSRKYGGTGLGLAISRELARLLGGEIKLQSTPEVGSEFTLYLPSQFVHQRAPRKTVDTARVMHSEQPLAVREAEVPTQRIETSEEVDAADREGDRSLLIVENDAAFANFLREAARERGFRTRVAPRGALAVAMAHDSPPDAITLDINLADMDGWRVLERLKSHPDTRHIPVQIISTEEERERGLRLGASGVLVKPVRERAQLDDVLNRLKAATDPQPRRIVVLGDADNKVTGAIESALDKSVSVIAANMDQALESMRSPVPDLVVVANLHGDATELELVARMRSDQELAEVPVVAYVADNLTRKGEIYVKRLKETAIVREARSVDRLIDESARFLHLRSTQLPGETRKLLEGMRNSRAVLNNKKVLIVDDDVRNIFALGTVLEPHGMKLMAAENGRQAIDILQNERDFDAVLMDIMMPEMDGYDTMRAIRQIGRLRSLPIIALTAKAMKGDREKCLEAGASDYVSKPVDTEVLLGVLRAWLYR